MSVIIQPTPAKFGVDALINTQFLVFPHSFLLWNSKLPIKIKIQKLPFLPLPPVKIGEVPQDHNVH